MNKWNSRRIFSTLMPCLRIFFLQSNVNLVSINWREKNKLPFRSELLIWFWILVSEAPINQIHASAAAANRKWIETKVITNDKYIFRLTSRIIWRQIKKTKKKSRKNARYRILFTAEVAGVSRVLLLLLLVNISFTLVNYQLDNLSSYIFEFVLHCWSSNFIGCLHLWCFSFVWRSRNDMTEKE